MNLLALRSALTAGSMTEDEVPKLERTPTVSGCDIRCMGGRPLRNQFS
jgi:hypothetical protein